MKGAIQEKREKLRAGLAVELPLAGKTRLERMYLYVYRVPQVWERCIYIDKLFLSHCTWVDIRISIFSYS